MLSTAGKVELSHDWPNEEINSGHNNLSLYKVKQPDGLDRYVYAIKLQSTVLPNVKHSPMDAIDEMIDHLNFIRSNPYKHSFIVE